MSRIKAAVVGCGHLGTIHAKLLAAREDVDLVAVVDPFAEAATRVAAAHGCRGVSSTAELDGLVDVAVVATPTALHAETAVPLLESGIDLLVEKPVTTTLAEADSIQSAARRHGRIVAVGHVERFNPAWAAAAARVRGPVMVQARRRAPFTFRSLDVGVVLDLMIHDIDLVLSLEPGSLLDVTATGVSASGGHEDAVAAHLRFESGLVADLVASRIHSGVDRSITIWSAGGVVSADFQSKEVESVVPSPAVAAGAFHAADVAASERERLKAAFFEEVLPRTVEQLPQGNAIAAEHDDFLRAVRSRRDPIVTAAAGARALDVALRVLESLTVVRLGQTLASIDRATDESADGLGDMRRRAA
jgi:predicted dehydrogenase